jgi:hypothetical protein
MKKMEKVFYVLTALAACTFLLFSCSLMNSNDDEADGTAGLNGTQKNILVTGVRTADTDGNTIFGSGGCMLQVGKYFYWYGEHRYSSGNFKGVSCYRSTDLINWENRGDILTESSSSDLNPAFLERPKVIYNATTKKYVLWAHRENIDWDYGLAKYIVAYGDSPDEPFTYYESRRPFDDPSFDVHDNSPESSSSTSGYENKAYGFMSRDCTLFVDDDGTAYFISSYAENYHMHIYRLTADYLTIDTSYWPTDDVLNASQREAPCLFKNGEYYYMITSGTSGWASTQTTIQYATNLRGPWSSTTVMSDTTGNGDIAHSDRSQPAYVFKLKATDGSSGYTYLYMGDRWGPAFGGSSTYDSQYVWIPLTFSSSDATSVTMKFSEALKVNTSTGTVSHPTYYYIENQYGYYLGNQTNVYSGQYSTWSSTTPADDTTTLYDDRYLYQWRIVPMTNGYQLVNRWSALALTANDDSPLSALNLITKDSDNDGQWWEISDIGTPYYSLKNYSSGYYATTTNGSTSTMNSTNCLFQIAWKYRDPTWVSTTLGYDALYLAVIKQQSWKLIPVTE